MRIPREPGAVGALARLQLAGVGEAVSMVLEPEDEEFARASARNIENSIGSVRIPVGLAGPFVLRDVENTQPMTYYVPLATTEAALVASYSRGASVVGENGGFLTSVIAHSVARAPVFIFANVVEAAAFASWIGTQLETFATVVATTTRHGRLISIEPIVEGNRVFVRFCFETGEAAGQNMVTLATHAVCRRILEVHEASIRDWYLEANFSADKKATSLTLRGARGRRVVAEAFLPAAAVEERLHTTPERLAEFCSLGTFGAALAGQIGNQGHYANGLAALYLATGQDVACVAESAIGITRFDVLDERVLHAVVTLPGVIVGTVGGGTGLPSQRACLELIGLPERGAADRLAQLAAALCLAGELSISAAISADQFSQAHRRFARGTT